MTNIEDILKKLVDQTGKPIQCSHDKGESSKFLKYKEAAKEPFIRFGNDKFIPALSLDIDTHKDSKKVLDTCFKHNLPYPSIILETKKGLHLHWVLENPINLSNLKTTYFYQQIISALVITFDTDTKAVPKNAGRLFRNPLKHPTKLYNSSSLSLNDFRAHAKTYKSITKPTCASARDTLFSHYKRPDFTKITAGVRNEALFDFGRAYAYRFAKSKDLDKSLLNKLQEVNTLLPEPLKPFELVNIGKSITRFINTRYIGKTTNKRTVDFNRGLAKKALDTTSKALLQIFVENPTLTLKALRKMSLREGGRLFGVHKNTFKRHLPILINDIENMTALKEVWAIEPTYAEAFTPHYCLSNTRDIQLKNST